MQIQTQQRETSASLTRLTNGASNVHPDLTLELVGWANLEVPQSNYGEEVAILCVFVHIPASSVCTLSHAIVMGVSALYGEKCVGALHNVGRTKPITHGMAV